MKPKSVPQPIRPPIVARRLWEVRQVDETPEFFLHQSTAQLAVELAEDENIAASMTPVCVLPCDEASLERMVSQIAREMDGLAFHEYKEGECLPRGHEMDSVEKVNEIQGFRQRSALSKARIALKSLGMFP